jgi:hypothetical protein
MVTCDMCLLSYDPTEYGFCPHCGSALVVEAADGT